MMADYHQSGGRDIESSSSSESESSDDEDDKIPEDKTADGRYYDVIMHIIQEQNLVYPEGAKKANEYADVANNLHSTVL